MRTRQSLVDGCRRPGVEGRRRGRRRWRDERRSREPPTALRRTTGRCEPEPRPPPEARLIAWRRRDGRTPVPVRRPARRPPLVRHGRIGRTQRAAAMGHPDSRAIERRPPLRGSPRDVPGQLVHGPSPATARTTSPFQTGLNSWISVDALPLLERPIAARTGVPDRQTERIAKVVDVAQADVADREEQIGS